MVDSCYYHVGPYNECMICCETAVIHCKDLLYVMFYLIYIYVYVLCICKNVFIGLPKTSASVGKFLYLDFKS
jgi:hypothetical protein